MLKNEIVVGGVYRARVSGNIVDVKVCEIVESEGRKQYSRPDYFGMVATRTIRAKVRYRCINLATNREIVVKSAAKFRRVSV